MCPQNRNSAPMDTDPSFPFIGLILYQIAAASLRTTPPSAMVNTTPPCNPSWETTPWHMRDIVSPHSGVPLVVDYEGVIKHTVLMSILSPPRQRSASPYLQDPPPGTKVPGHTWRQPHVIPSGVKGCKTSPLNPQFPQVPSTLDRQYFPSQVLLPTTLVVIFCAAWTVFLNLGAQLHRSEDISVIMDSV